MRYKIAIFVMILVVANFSFAYSGGPANAVDQGYTGAPGESGVICSTCHSGGPYGPITTNIFVTDSMMQPVGSFISGETYTIGILITPQLGIPGGYGFQATVLNSANAFIGTFSNPSSGSVVANAANVGGRTYWENSASSIASAYTINWTAPAIIGMDTVTIYAMGIAVDGTGGTNGDNGGNGTSFSTSLPVELYNFSIE